MSLYNMLFGVNKAAPVLLKILGIDYSKVPRFRDCFLSDGMIVLHTRTGGGNREYYDEPNSENTEGPWNTTMYENVNFIRDEDDDFDSTYANFYFNFPEEYKADLEALSKGIEDYKPSEKWKKLFKAFENNSNND
jgi:hypothetical protein